mmetsp:Transcript_24638/g.67143  ORF Transcript_24638/g.67143 Transcript_24638/m.67143 type:complete len:243 (-) Transcript_24638:467-1195(-)|eukprot:CAMPEP_0202355096 /NCGR_PEP_ID=MMETSP1126-20121109/10130_1 /ASSEMBLY_ACC=CAM_ASM_000457 /TAXON_ID=3047 /ORGANISM="Dunaliella tertiolecta, Strain CCMP1320" /LENGTH=242 /DNA_ID=CAMNT_0048947649 /DNA_START=143 /DNA_END=871 /DNA_ORIENTATION=-
MNNNRLDEAALSAGGKGVFSKPSYITIGSKERPEEYGKKLPVRSSEKGKQLSTVPPKEGKTIDAYFEKKHNWINDGDQYQDRWRYRDSKQEKKKGFLTSDFSKRDEFSNVIRTGQWREQLQLEDKFSKKAIQMFSETAGVNNSPGTQTQGHDEPETFLYDLVFDKDDPNFIGASKTHRDTKNRTMQSKDRNLGQTMTTNALTYTPPSDFVKPDYARKPVIRDTFYRGTNVFFPSSCSADPSA